MRIPWRVAAVVVAAGSTCFCGYYNSSLIGPQASDASSDADAAVCPHAQPPSPPAAKDAGGNQDFVLVMRTIDFRENGDYKALGFDQDRTCTCEGEGLSCTPPPGVTQADQCDGPSGRDNSVSSLITQSAILGLSSESINVDISNGGSTGVLRVQGYNGQPDDDQVTVSWLVPVNFGVKPVWEGKDGWPIKKSCLNNGDIEHPKAVDANAYVSGGNLVASLKGSAPMQFGNIHVAVTAAFIVAPLIASGTTWRTEDGLMAGIWIAQEMLAQLPTGILVGAPLCMNHSFYPKVKELICGGRDISSKNSLPSEPCDSISMAFSFKAEPAVIGLLVDDLPVGNPCDAGANPATDDSCDRD